METVDKINKYLREGSEKKKTLTLYHGVKNPKNVEKILKNGFNLSYIKTNWMNDHAVSAVKSEKAVKDFFGGRPNMTILKFKFSGNVWTADDNFDSLGSEYTGFPKRPQDYTRNLVKAGIDAVEMYKGSQYFIYNPKKITNIQVVK